MTMHEQQDSQVESAELNSPVARHGAASLVVKIVICVVSVLTLLGGTLAFQQTKRAPAKAGQPSVQGAPATEADDLGRPTSRPYTGTLSIFEDPKREEKLQINRVMDVLKIKEGSSVADIGAGSGWFTV